MARISSLYNRLRPMIPQAVQPNKVATGWSLIHVSAETMRLWLHCLGSHHSGGYPRPDAAPTAAIDTVTTDTGFSLIDGTHDAAFEIPWLLQKRFDSIRVVLAVAHTGPLNNIAARVSAQTFITSVTTVNSPYIPFGDSARAPAGLWKDSTGWRISVVTCDIQPNVPSSRLIVLKPQVIWDPPNNTNTISVTRTLKLFAWTAWDILSDYAS